MLKKLNNDEVRKITLNIKKEVYMNAFKCPNCGNITRGNEKFCVTCG